MFRWITFYWRDSLINSVCNHHHTARLSTILHQRQPQIIASHWNILQKALEALDVANLLTALPKQWLLLPTDGALSHTSGVAQQHLHKELGMRFVDKFSWPPSSPDYLSLDYYFWNVVKWKVYSGRRAPFKDLEEF